MSREDPQMKIRLPEALKGQIEGASATNNRTMNAEIVARLQASFEEGPSSKGKGPAETPDMLIEGYRQAVRSSEEVRALLGLVLVGVLTRLPEEALQDWDRDVLVSTMEWLGETDPRGAVHALLRVFEGADKQRVGAIRAVAKYLDRVREHKMIEVNQMMVETLRKMYLNGGLRSNPVLSSVVTELAPKRPANKGPERSGNARAPIKRRL